MIYISITCFLPSRMQMLVDVEKLFFFLLADGICHVYVDKSANMDMAKQIILDAKTEYPSACNSMVFHLNIFFLIYVGFIIALQ